MKIKKKNKNYKIKKNFEKNFIFINLIILIIIKIIIKISKNLLYQYMIFN
jgi:hypothetical protein